MDILLCLVWTLTCAYIALSQYLHRKALEAAMRQRDHINEVCRADSAADEKWLMEPEPMSPVDRMIQRVHEKTMSEYIECSVCGSHYHPDFCCDECYDRELQRRRHEQDELEALIEPQETPFDAQLPPAAPVVGRDWAAEAQMAGERG